LVAGDDELDFLADAVIESVQIELEHHGHSSSPRLQTSSKPV
jgi:hypothetical protein